MVPQKKLEPMKILLTLVLTSLILAAAACQKEHSCALILDENTSIHSDKLCGKIIDGYYHDPKGIFSFKIPKAEYSRTLEEYFVPDETAWSIRVTDHYGNHFTFDVASNDSEKLRLANIRPETECKATYKMFFDVAAVGSFKKLFPSQKVLEERFIKLNRNSYAQSAILYLPCGSTVFNSKTNTQFDARRAILLSFTGNFIVMTHVQEPIAKLHALENNPELLSQYNDELFDQLIELHSTFTLKHQK